MYRCLNESCNHVFDQMEIETWVEEHGEHVSGCPICGEGFEEFNGEESCSNCKYFSEEHKGYFCEYYGVLLPDSDPEELRCNDYRWEAL